MHFANVIRALSGSRPDDLWIEALTPDFSGALHHVTEVATSGLHVYAHNLETIERLTPRVRDRRATYRQSLDVLRHVKSLGIDHVLTKTSLMLGLGETPDEVQKTLEDLRTNHVNVVTFGQYLQPTRRHLPVKEYITPQQFDDYREMALKQFDFDYVASGPLVRSSYRAGEFFLKNLLQKQKEETEAAI
mmetsp:Transcript_1537/g.3807  ORF Transcript_1537/g.3807 Transcript_1537/m.3807 type:complete len:189 (-) Transcript_1537:87-653(-)